MSEIDWLAGIGPGWHPLVQPLIDRCKADGVRIDQVKQKFGGLRFYVGPASFELESLIHIAEARSFGICERCGEPGSGRGTDYIRTLCDLHAR
jgi:hypothetical protein